MKKMKRLLIVILVVVLLTGMLTVGASAGYVETGRTGRRGHPNTPT